jgi:hypothetical protein
MVLKILHHLQAANERMIMKGTTTDLTEALTMMTVSFHAFILLKVCADSVPGQRVTKTHFGKVVDVRGCQ